jgi:TRAP-type transport system periplasmic protein
MNCFKKVLLGLCFVGFSAFANAQTEIKFATLAPEGSTWMNIMREFGSEVSEKTSGQVKFKMYSGGVHGDEKDVIRKIRIGQLHAGGFTGVGIGEISPELRVLDAPFLFKSSREADYIYKKFDSEFRQLFRKKGYVLLGWAEVGFVYLFTDNPITKPEDLKETKMWMWEGDPIAEATFKAIGISPIPLSITDVMTSLQTGMVNGVYGSTLSVVALQWFTKVKYMFSLPIANASGAVLVSLKQFKKLTPDQQKILLDAGDRYFSKLTDYSRMDNEKSIATLKKNGIKITYPYSDEVKRVFEEKGKEARESLAGKLYSKDLLSRIETALTEFRNDKVSKKK